MKVTRLPVNQRHQLMDEYYELKKSGKVPMVDEQDVQALALRYNHSILPNVIAAGEYYTFLKLLPKYMDEYLKSKGAKVEKIIYDVRPDEHRKWYVGILKSGDPNQFSPIGHSYSSKFEASKHMERLERRHK